ncbi:MAG: CBS domain-containing protein [Saprospiraceae bacterium]
MNSEKSIQDIMTIDLVAVNPEDMFSDVKALFDKNDFHHLLVVGENEELLGIISREDLWRTAYHVSFVTTGQTFSKNWYTNYQVKNMMTKNPITIEPEDTLGLAADIFSSNKFRALPVVDGEELVGIVTPYDLMQYAFNDISFSE